MTTLRSAPYNLDYDDEVIFNVIAVNVIGDSPVSNDSPTGAKVQTAPVQMSAPVRGISTSET
jgi:hypothetical protein